MTRLLRSLLPMLVVLAACSQNQQQQPAAKESEQFVDTTAFQPVPEQQQHITELKLNLKQGDVFRYKLEQVEKLVQDDSMSVSQSSMSYYTKTVKSVRDGLMTFTIRYDSVMEKQSGRGMGSDDKDVSYRSTDSNDRKNKTYAMVNAMIGEEISVTVDSHGKIQEVAGISTIINRLAASSDKPIEENVRAQAAEQIKQMYYAQLVTQEQVSMPDSALDATMSWKKNVQQQIPPVFVNNSTMEYAVTRVSSLKNRTVAEVKAKLSGRIELANPKVPVTLKAGSVSGEGSAIVDTQSGNTLRKQTSIRQELQASATNPNTQKAEAFKQVKTSTMTVTLLK